MTDSNLFSLSQADHPYYGAEGHEERYSSWAEFMEHGAPERDPDMNLLYRWDWKVPDEDRDQHELLLFYILQRKSYFSNVIIFVQPEDDAAIRAWLSEKLSYLLTLWTPVSTPAPATSGADVTEHTPVEALDLFISTARAIGAARAVSPAPAQATPPGWRLVPDEPTPEQYVRIMGGGISSEKAKAFYWAMIEAAPPAPGAAPTQQPQPADALSDALSGEVAWKALAAILNATGTEDGEGEYRADDREGCLDFVEHTARAALRSRQSVQGEGRNNG